VLRAALWRYNKDFRTATQLAIRSGLMIAITLIVGGIYSFIKFPDYGITGLWMMIIGLMIALMLGTTEGRTRGVCSRLPGAAHGAGQPGYGRCVGPTR